MEEPAGVPGGLVGRLAGGVLALVVLGTAVVGLMLGTRTARLFARFEAQIGAIARAELNARLRAVNHEVLLKGSEADAAGDWSPLQAWLPTRAAADPELVALFITDADGLVVADADPSKNGRPLADERLRSLLRRPDVLIAELSIDGKPALVAVERITTADKVVRMAWAIASASRVRDAQVAIANAGHDSVRFGWILVGLGGFIVAIVALGVVVVVGGSVARRLQAVSWRIGQLGRGDRSTHLRMDGPAELHQLGTELDLAARRIAAAELGQREQSATAAIASARVALVAAATALPARLAGIELARAAPRAPHGTAVAAVAREGGALLWMIEVVGDRLDDLFAAGALSAAAAAHARREPALTPAQLLERLDRDLPPGQRARALVLSLADGGAVRVASAGARLPLLHRPGAAPSPLVVRGDRLGEPEAARGAELPLSLSIGDALYLLGEPPAGAAAARAGHLCHEQVAALAALPADADAAARAQALVGTDVELHGGVAIALLRVA